MVVMSEAERFLERRQGILQHSSDAPTAIHPVALLIALCCPCWYQSLGMCVEGVVCSIVGVVEPLRVHHLWCWGVYECVYEDVDLECRNE